MRSEKMDTVRLKAFDGYCSFRHEMTDFKIMEWIKTDMLAKLAGRPQKSVRLETPEISEIDPAWDVIEETLDDVEKRKYCYDFHHFCILEYIESPSGYIQTVYHQPAGKWILEFRETFHDGSYVHYKAGLKSCPEYKRFVDFESVKSAFRAFYYGLPWPENFAWEKFDI